MRGPGRCGVTALWLLHPVLGGYAAGYEPLAERGGAVASGPVAVAGEALVDALGSTDAAHGGPHMVRRPGGSPYNVAIGLARLGIAVSFHGAVGADDDGRLLRAHARRSGVDTSGMLDASWPTMRATAVVDASGEARYRFNIPDCAAIQWRPSAGEGADAAVLHVGSIASWLSPAADAIEDLVDQAMSVGALLCVDPNLRPAVLNSPTLRLEATRRIQRLVARAGVVKASAADLRWLHPESAPADAARAWSARCPGLVVMTDGSEAAVGFLAGQQVIRRAAAPARVRDTVGAGDAFMAALLAGLVGRGALSVAGVRAVAGDARELAEVLDVAHAVAAVTCERIGADPPTAAEADAWRNAGR